LANASAPVPAVGVFTGRHVLAELFGVRPEPLDDEAFLRRVMVAAVTECGATVCQVISQRFRPQGVTVLALLSESHASLHSYPENGSVFVDVFTCGDRADPRLAVDALVRALQPASVRITVVRRGRLGGAA
jgi:S-adenosylmethionine decarboxylase